MAKGELLRELIGRFDVQTFIRFLTSANSAFRPLEEDFGHYLGVDNSFADFRKVGEIEFDDIDRLLVATCRSVGGLTGRTGKRDQYELAKKVLKDTYADAGLFLFYDTAGNFRLSFVCAQYQGTRRTFSTFRRYTYFVCPALSNKTFLNQIGKCSFTSIEAILEAFSIEAVSELFYNDFKPKFDQIAQAVKGVPKKEPQLCEDFALLFAIRIIFLGFVQKKGWLGGDPHFIQDYWKEYKSRFEGQNEFYDRWLIPLFFEALNSEPGRKVQWQNNDFSKETEAILQMAPFLNGELFKIKTGVDDRNLSLPDAVIGIFIDWLFSYNFTIEENDLYDEELEVNPEFLGIIFERLVNKADGAVYTPRTEVDLMCRLGLLNWLAKNAEFDKKELYHQFFREGGSGAQYDDDQKDGNFSANEIRRQVGLLESVTICDPAAGSGAFEVGMLHVINETLEKLYDNRNWPADLPKKDAFDRKKAIIGQSLYGVEVKRWAVWINQLRLWLTLFIDMPDEMKLSPVPLLPSLNFKIRRGDSIVQRIGGKLFPVHGHADIAPAVKKKITELKKAKLDFFYNRGPDEAMVRQMEYKVFQSIIHSQIEDKQKALDALEPPKKQMGLGFAADDAEQGHFLKLEQFEKKRLMLNDEAEELKAELRNLAEDHPLVWSIEFSEIFYEKGGFDIIIGNPPYVQKEDIGDPDRFLEPKIYKQLLQQTMQLDFPKHFVENRNITGKSDLYTFFYVRSLHLLNENGVHIFICSNSWLDVGYGTWMQEFLLNRVPVRWIIDNHARRSFASADVNTIISVMDAPLRKGAVPEDHLVKFVAFKKPFEDCIFTEKLWELEMASEIIKNDVFRIFPIANRQLYDAGWEVEEGAKKESGKYIGDKWGGKYLRAPDVYFSILKNKNLMRLTELAEVNEGKPTGANNYFFPPEKIVSKYKIEKKFLKNGLMKTRGMSFFEITTDMLDRSFLDVSSIGNISDVSSYNVHSYLRYGEEQIVPLSKTLKSKKKWWQVKVKKHPSIVSPCGYGDVFFCAYNLGGAIPSNSYTEIRPFYSKDEKIIHCFLNSSCGWLCLEILGRASLGGGMLKVDPTEYRRLRVPKIAIDKIHYPSRQINTMFTECGIDPESEIPLSEQEPKPLPDRKALDDVVFDALNLTADERKEVYRAVCQLVWNRISKAKSVKKRK